MSKWGKGRFLVFLALLCALLCSGCTKGRPPSVTLPPVSTPQPTSLPISQQGTLRLAMPSSVLTWHPLRANQREVRSLLWLVYEPLVEVNEAGEPSGALAQSWTVDETGRKWTFFLRPNITWHDGRPLTSQDVVYTLAMLQEIQESETLTSPYTSRLNWIESWEAPDDTTVMLTVCKPFYGILHGLDFPILPKHASLSAMAESRQLVGTGPYRLDYLDENGMQLTAQDNWWRKKPEIQTISVTAYRDAQAALSALYLQQLDAVQTDAVSAEPYGHIQNVHTYRYLTPYFSFLAFNLQSDKVSTPAMRQAITYGIDRSALVSDVYGGGAVQVDAPIMPTSWLSNGKLLTYGYQPGKTVATLEKVGWRRKQPEDTYYNISPGGVPGDLTLRLLVCGGEGSVKQQEAAQMIQTQLKRTGICVDIVTKPWDDYLLDLEEGAYDIALGSWYLSKVPDLSPLLSSNGSLNPNGYYTGTMDALLETVLQQTTPQGLKDATDAVCDQLLHELPWMSLYFESHALILGSNLTGIASVSEDNVYQGIAQWRFVPES